MVWVCLVSSNITEKVAYKITEDLNYHIEYNKFRLKLHKVRISPAFS